MSIEEKLREYILESFLFSDDQSLLSNKDSFLEKGILDSTGVLEIISFLEDEYDIVVDDEDMTPENLDSIESIVAYINKKRSA
jgi:acyl carrier protein